ncbi:MBL fold metallo-hydrolase [Intrasporangium calvum]|uniref:Beta-lactamase class B n=1 Tax=Intrasporangium calvum (strain ATCC 23552 / DSM 43043 / JCM 3097 / NBRC 12989 / NCIMB 10167 / NRRL B-3866 / 7 KIP) TaxID=710696 RepID=E6SCN0_INTC7|nr:MBL fold metallo-hydrolase [Intrasporangium calvum]ADU49634.1 beta-lactamase class B [Intrasporangium calvum DSM 43043]
MPAPLEQADPRTNRTTLDWTEPGAFEVADGVYRIPLPLPLDGLHAVNIYVIDTGEGLLSIDGGWAVAPAREALRAALTSVGYGIGDIRQFLVTHLHRDHYTQAVALRREFGARVSLGVHEQVSLALVRTPAGRSHQTQLDQLVVAGAGAVAARLVAGGFAAGDEDIENLEAPDEWLSPEQAIRVSETRSLHARHTPGHTQGHVVFVDESEGLLFAGDHVLPHITPSIGFEPAPSHLPLRDYLDSLRRVRAMADLVLLPAHGMPGPSTHARIDQLLQHHEDRLQACLDSVGPAGTTAFEVAAKLPWTSRMRSLDDLDPFNQMLAVCETAAHLDLLAERGSVVVSEHRGRRVYQA